jgi:hypothetical protein
MIVKRSVGEAKTLYWTILIDDINDSASIQPIATHVVSLNSYILIGGERSIRPIESNPPKVKHLPFLDSFDGSPPSARSTAQSYSVAINRE